MSKKFLIVLTVLLSFVFFNACNKSDSGSDPTPTPGAAIGVLAINPNGLMANQNFEVIVRLVVPAGIQVQDSTVILYKADDNNQPTTEEFGKLYDNGDLNNGDEIIADNVFTGKFNMNVPNAGTLKLIAVGVDKTTGKSANSEILNVNVVANLSSQEVKAILNTQETASNQFVTYLAGNISNLETAVDQTVQWFQSQATVESAEKSGYTIEVKYKSGVYGGVVIQSKNSSGSVELRGGGNTDPKRNQTRQIPPKFQTVGTINSYPSATNNFKKNQAPDPKLIGNRSVLIYAPFENAFSPANEGQNIVNILNNSGFKFEIDYYKNEQANVEVLYNLTNYGYVVLATHGSGGNSFATGETVDTNSSNYKNKYKALIAAQKLAIWKQVTIGYNAGAPIKRDIYAVRHGFISDITGTFPNSVILNNSCESTKSPALGNAFVGKGAKTYYGYSKIVSSKFCVINADTLTKRLAKDLKTTGDAFMAGNDPYSVHNAAFQMVGANDVHYPDELINGDFEYGKIDGWTKAGDGRVISKLGFIAPTQGSFMGIISTGLGYTTATGSIFQTFTIAQNQTTLTVKWNFISEEFLEFINSSYQDYFKISIKDENGNETLLFSKTIDGIAAMFGATKENSGNLVKVSPGIVFDRGDAYMTDWNTSTFDVSAFKGKRVTLTLAAGDVGDSIYDTAILLDEISIK